MKTPTPQTKLPWSSLPITGKCNIDPQDFAFILHACNKVERLERENAEFLKALKAIRLPDVHKDARALIVAAIALAEVE